jgi:hypothetical protein
MNNIIVQSYVNFAWGKQHRKIIFNLNDLSVKVSNDGLLKHVANLEEYEITMLKKLFDSINNIKLITTVNAIDAGQHAITLYKNNQAIVISKWGNETSESNDSNVIKMSNLIKKLTNEVSVMLSKKEKQTKNNSETIWFNDNTF